MNKEESMYFIAGWYEPAGTTPPSGATDTTAFLIANNVYRRKLLNIVQNRLGGDIRDFTTHNNKTLTGLFFTKEEWIKNLTSLLPYIQTEERQHKITRLINGLKG